MCVYICDSLLRIRVERRRTSIKTDVDRCARRCCIADTEYMTKWFLKTLYSTCTRNCLWTFCSVLLYTLIRVTCCFITIKLYIYFNYCLLFIYIHWPLSLTKFKHFGVSLRQTHWFWVPNDCILRPISEYNCRKPPKTRFLSK